MRSFISLLALFTFAFTVACSNENRKKNTGPDEANPESTKQSALAAQRADLVDLSGREQLLEKVGVQLSNVTADNVVTAALVLPARWRQFSRLSENDYQVIEVAASLLIDYQRLADIYIQRYAPSGEPSSHIESIHAKAKLAATALEFIEHRREVDDLVLVRDELSEMGLYLEYLYSQVGAVRYKTDRSVMPEFLKKTTSLTAAEVHHAQQLDQELDALIIEAEQLLAVPAFHAKDLWGNETFADLATDLITLATQSKPYTAIAADEHFNSALAAIEGLEDQGFVFGDESRWHVLPPTLACVFSKEILNADDVAVLAKTINQLEQAWYSPEIPEHRLDTRFAGVQQMTLMLEFRYAAEVMRDQFWDLQNTDDLNFWSDPAKLKATIDGLSDSDRDSLIEKIELWLESLSEVERLSQEEPIRTVRNEYARAKRPSACNTDLSEGFGNLAVIIGNHYGPAWLKPYVTASKKAISIMSNDDN